MTLDWENDVDVIKKGAATLIYMLPNMFITMGLIVLSVVLGMIMSHALLTIMVTVVALILAIISYAIVMNMAKKN